jgi:hypothetical protein
MLGTSVPVFSGYTFNERVYLASSWITVLWGEKDKIRRK